MTTASAQELAVNGDRNFVTGISPAMQTLESVIAEIAPTSIPVLLIGESGTGKEMFAHRVHSLSAHRDEPLRKIRCSTMNPAMFSPESGLSAHTDDHAATNTVGTVLFDEISELDAACQRNLLYALPDGDMRPRQGMLTARVISTTVRNLDEEMRAGRFRSELYYRINGICFRLPPLRERKDDIPLLVESFLTKYAEQLVRPRPLLSPRTLRAFMDHAWPGNIRELENIVRKIVALGDDQFAVMEIATAPQQTETVEPTEVRGYSLKAASRAASREAERELIMKVLTRTQWNRKRAAQELQISYKSLLYKLKQIGLQDSEAR